MIKRKMDKYIWSHYDLKPGNFVELTRKVWIKGLNNESILEPLEKLDQRVTLVNINFNIMFI
jgi:hypothetical protein